MQRHVSLSILTLAALAVLASSAVAQTITTYRWVDAQGVVHYSDTPQPGAQKIEVQSAQTYRAPAAPKGSNPSQKPTTQATASAYQCGITAPTPEQSFYNPESIAISVSVSPALGA